jgi:hypothetical protein
MMLKVNNRLAYPLEKFKLEMAPLLMCIRMTVGRFLQNPKVTHEEITAEIDAGKLIPDIIRGRSVFWLLFQLVVVFSFF